VRLDFDLVPRLCSLLLVVVALALGAPALARAEEAPESSARAVLVADGRTGEVLHVENPNRRLPLASITKLMTALVVLERARPGEIVTVPRFISSVGESSIGLSPGERISVRDLLAAALIQSANDAAYALAAHVGHGKVRAFVRLMNVKARELGLAETHFVRPDGLDASGHYSSASDVLALARAAMQRPLIRRLVRSRRAKIGGGRFLFAWNDLLGSFPGMFGIKTGHTDRAGWCEVGSARRDGASVYAIVLGSPSRSRRNRDLAELLDWGLDQYARATVVHEGRTYASADVPMSDESLALVPAEPARAVVRLRRPLVERVTAPRVVEPPVERGERVGEVVIMDGERVVARRPLVAAESVDEPGLAARVGWYAGRTLDEAGGMLSGVVGAIL
jgi:serine-type D-Ala-D-Ala carboxypeptidase (penicillin-binding protein 5/6)